MSVAHLYGVALYYSTCYAEEAYKGVVYSRPEFLYFWVYYVGFNAPWVFIPLGTSSLFFFFFFFFRYFSSDWKASQPSLLLLRRKSNQKKAGGGANHSLPLLRLSVFADGQRGLAR